MIKILHKITSDLWIDSGEFTKGRFLKGIIKELVDDNDWTIIAATIEYIILQKKDYTQASINKENTNKFFGIDIAKSKHSEFTPEKEAEKKVLSKRVI